MQKRLQRRAPEGYTVTEADHVGYWYVWRGARLVAACTVDAVLALFAGYDLAVQDREAAA